MYHFLFLILRDYHLKIFQKVFNCTKIKLCMNKDFKKLISETARDLIALGGIPFFILIIGRVWMLDKPYYPFQFIIGGIIFLLLMFIFKSNLHSGLGLIALIFTLLYYEHFKFSVFAILAYCLMIFSLIYLKKSKKEIFKGILFGIISSSISYYLVEVLFLK